MIGRVMLHLITGSLQHFAVETADVRFVLHHQNAMGRACLAMNWHASRFPWHASRFPCLLGLRHFVILQIMTIKHLGTDGVDIRLMQNLFHGFQHHFGRLRDMRSDFIAQKTNYKLKNIAEAIRCFTHAGLDEIFKESISRR